MYGLGRDSETNSLRHQHIAPGTLRPTAEPTAEIVSDAGHQSKPSEYDTLSINRRLMFKPVLDLGTGHTYQHLDKSMKTQLAHTDKECEVVDADMPVRQVTQPEKRSQKQAEYIDELQDKQWVRLGKHTMLGQTRGQRHAASTILHKSPAQEDLNADADAPSFANHFQKGDGPSGKPDHGGKKGKEKEMEVEIGWKAGQQLERGGIRSFDLQLNQLQSEIVAKEKDFNSELNRLRQVAYNAENARELAARELKQVRDYLAQKPDYSLAHFFGPVYSPSQKHLQVLAKMQLSPPSVVQRDRELKRETSMSRFTKLYFADNNYIPTMDTYHQFNSDELPSEKANQLRGRDADSFVIPNSLRPWKSKETTGPPMLTSKKAISPLKTLNLSSNFQPVRAIPPACPSKANYKLLDDIIKEFLSDSIDPTIEIDDNNEEEPKQEIQATGINPINASSRSHVDDTKRNNTVPEPSQRQSNESNSDNSNGKNQDQDQDQDQNQNQNRENNEKEKREPEEPEDPEEPEEPDESARTPDVQHELSPRSDLQANNASGEEPVSGEVNPEENNKDISQEPQENSDND